MSNADTGADAGHISPLPPHTPHPGLPAWSCCKWLQVGEWRAASADMALLGDGRLHDITAIQCASKWLRSGILVIDCDRRYHSMLDCDHDRDRAQPYCNERFGQNLGLWGKLRSEFRPPFGWETMIYVMVLIYGLMAPLRGMVGN